MTIHNLAADFLSSC